MEFDRGRFVKHLMQGTPPSKPGGGRDSIRCFAFGRWWDLVTIARGACLQPSSEACFCKVLQQAPLLYSKGLYDDAVKNMADNTVAPQ
jgi:hypothetical protein